MAQITNEMATNLTLDIGSAQKSLRELTSTVKDSNNEWKIQEAQLKASGDAANASKARYEGLQNTLSEQKNKVDALKQALDNNNTETKKGQELQTYLTNELAKAERQYASYQGQLDKATQSYKYQESGLAKLNDELKQSNDLTDARARKLESEGHVEEAQKTRLDGLKNAQANYTKQLEIQTSELNKLADSGDKSSESYKRQELRVAQMGAKLAQTERAIKDFNRTEIKPQSSGINKVREQLHALDDALEGTRNQFKNVFLGNLVATGVTNALSSIKDHFTGALKAGIDYNKEMENVKLGLSNFTNGDDKLSEQLLSNIKAIKESSGYATDTVTLLTKKTYGLTKNVDGALTMTDAFTNLGRATGKSDEAMGNLITKFFQANASGKITTGSLTKLNKELPGFTDALGKNLGVSRDKLNQLATDGKLSMQQLGDAIQTMSDSKPLGLDNYYKSVDGFTNHFEERYKSLSGKLTEGFFTQSNGLLATFSKSLDGDAVDKAFSRIGDSANKAVNTVAKAFGDVFKGQKVNPLESMANATADAITKLGNFIASHAKDITNLFKSMKELGSAGFGTMGTTLKIALPLLESLGKFATTHPEAFKILAGSILGLNLALKGTLSVMSSFSRAKKAFNALSGLIIKPRVDGGPAKRELGIISKIVVGIGKGVWWTAKLAAKAVLKTLEQIGNVVIGIGKGLAWTAKLAWTGVKKVFGLIKIGAIAVGKGMKWTASVATKGAQLALKGLLATAKVTGNGIKLAFNFMKANPLILLVTAITAVVVAFAELYKHNKKFRDFVNGIVSAAADFFKGIGKWFGQAWDTISKFFSQVLNFVKKDWKEILLLIVNPFAGAFALIYKHNDNFRKAINDLVKSVVGFFKDLWRNVTDIFGNIADFISSTLSGIGKFWDKTWNTIFGTVRNIWNYISKLVHDSISSISDVIGNVLGGIGNVWRGTWQGLSDFFGGIWRSIKGYASDGINGVLNVINAGVDAIDSVWKFFTGHETSIHHLQPVKFAQGGVVTQRLAMVNDGDGPDWKELIQLPNGDMKMSQQRNAVMPLPVGTRVYNGKETKDIMNYMGVEKYAGGGIVGGAINWAKGALSDVGSWIGDKFDAIDAFLKNPLSAVQGLISKAVDPLISSLGNFGQLASGVFNKLMSPLSDWFTKGLKKVQDEGQGAPAGAGVQRWADQVKQALSANGLSTSDGMVQKVLRQIQTESGGSEKAVQGGYTDVNTISGDLAKGLMQTISATFNAYAFPGHHNIFNGYDNLLAALDYAKNRYGSNLSYLGQGHGYANGGLITQHQIAEIGEGNKPEVIIPLDGMKSSRGFELLGKTAVAMAARDGKTSQGVSDGSEVTQLLSQNNQLLGVVTQILGAILGETEKGNEPLSALSINRLSRLITSSTVRSAN
ncbi:tape measure protein [Leuconostoc lactis]|uniref:tape measure protein n=1 Tax=Leuconostoc lactis TaxID=1246 RepID=UPI00351E0A50